MLLVVVAMGISTVVIWLYEQEDKSKRSFIIDKVYYFLKSNCFYNLVIDSANVVAKAIIFVFKSLLEMNEKISCPIKYTDTIHYSILFIETLQCQKPSKAIHKLLRRIMC